MDAKEFKEFQEEQGKIVATLRETVEKAQKEKKENDSNVQATIATLNGKLDGLESKNQELVTKQLEDEKAITAREDEAKGRIDDLEKKLLRMPAGGDGSAAKAEVKALETFITKGQGNLSPEELKYLRTDSDTDGGYLAPNEYVNEIIKSITEVSPIRSIARVRRTSSKAIEVPKRTSAASGGWTGEGETRSSSESAYGMVEIPANKLTAVSIATVEMLADSAFNMETEMNADIVETFAQLEGAAFVTGNGVKKPQGFMVNGDIAITNSGVANAITADSLITISGELKDGYNGMYVMNRRTLATIRTLKDGQGQYLWQNGIALGLPSTINGDRYVSAIDMADIAANALPVAYGDFSRGYTIVDGVNLAFVRDSFTLAADGKVRIIAHRRVGGEVVQPEAIKHLKIAV